MIEQGMEHYRREQSRHEDRNLLRRPKLREELGTDCEDSGGTTVHDRRSQAPDDPDDEVCVWDRFKVVGILKQGKTCSNGESENRSVNKKTGPLGTDEPTQ